ncbi:hypothetical protein HCBG_07276 [Histoplasma capsulatum G186AR]|uniref:MADS-box domain-containing protein n=2 Tax=Ajellomyces capsulatus TaxID=5037 RepID=C0NVU6_AJECG|nr:uncharacterized protein HCBG_07276 [Histoplasma capsulatum G186AR]EEH04635.1 hypothetical protein HCBG_07276 [Histoplasma capsulatum G186AR]KAG5296465.1 hypothetical protein I7I52_07164 [Histoplasma capsulatum]QSS74448.1 hypothetical protein I7I50_09634 [Histoplasma capsulatum G186AR]
MGGPDPFRKDREMFKKRKDTVQNKCFELVRCSGAQVYLLIKHPERGCFEFNSEAEPPHLESQEFVERKGMMDFVKSPRQKRKLEKLIGEYLKKRDDLRRTLVVPEAPKLV